nr:amidohydrolase family protein [Clostridia bacterium]
MEKYPNAYLDLSGTGLFRYAMLAHGVNRVGAERFLFGTDFPVCNAAMQVAAVLSEYLTDEDYELIFSGNAKRLLGL